MTDDELDHRPLGRGKYSLLTPDQIAQKDPAYLAWAYDTWVTKPCSRLLYLDCERELHEDGQQRRVERDQDRE